MKSYWTEEFDDKINFPEVKEDLETDVCIIGGGLTGLSCGYYLSKEMKIIVLERDEICSSTSGKNTGKLTSQHGLFYKYLIDANGEKFAKKYFEANEKAIDNIEKIIKEENIECEFEKEDSYVFTMNQNGISKIKDEQKAVEKIAENKSEYVEDINLPIQIKAAIKFKNQAKLNPVKYGYGLAKCILKNNSKIYENSKLIAIDQKEDKYEITVNGKKIIAENVIIATRYPSINFPGYYFLKMYQSTSYAIVAKVKEELFEGMYISSDSPVISFRGIEQDGEKLLLAVGYDYKTGKEQVENGYLKLEETIKSMYSDVKILYKWTAEDCISLDKISYIGEYSNLMKNIYIATGFNKWGLTSSNVAANILKDKVLGIANKYEEVFKSTRLEPLKNKDEFKNMLKEAGKSIILSKFKLPEETLKDIKQGEGKIIEHEGEKIGVYKDENEKIFKVKPVCTHLGCELYFNNYDKIWECPCHGSKFTYEGKAIEVPGIKHLEIDL